MDPAALRNAVTNLVGQFISDLALMVGIDSGSHNATGVNKVADLAIERLEALGCTIERIPAPPPSESGDVVIARLAGSGTSRVLLLAHLDTVFDDGEAARRPFRIASDGRAHGPGVCDNKAGVLAAVYVLRALLDTRAPRPAELIVCLSPDEEIGSPTARPHIEHLARSADAVLSLECAREDGALVHARKGVAEATISLHGRAAHAGIEPERGADAAAAAAVLVLALPGAEHCAPGVRVNVGIVRAGTRVNVVCDTATIGLEVRARTQPDLDQALHEIARIVDVHRPPGITATTTIAGHCPPWPASEQSTALLDLATDVGNNLGLQVQAAATGGVADANYAAALGNPTLDGLGPVGGDDHSDDEWLDTTTIAARLALLAGIVAKLAT